MKMNFKSMMIAAVAMTTMMASCSKENGDGPESGNDGDKTVFFQMKHSSGDSRAAATHVENEEAVTINDAYIYFVDESNNITRRVQLVPNSSDPYDEENKTVGMELAETGATITAVPSSTSNVYIVGNYPSETYPAEEGNLNTLLTSATLTVESQYNDATGGVEKVTLFGSGELEEEDAANNEYSASIIVKPVAARIEIGRITATDPETGSRIKSYEVAGIYINRYYPTMSFNGSVAGTYVNNGSDKSKYNGAYNGSAYIGLDKKLSDYTSIVNQSSNSLVYAPKANADEDTDVWAYNLLAPTLSGAAMSSIVIHIANVVLTDDSTEDANAYTGDRYLTIRNLYDNSVLVEALAQGTVYRIKDLQFTLENLTELPEMRTIEVEVDVDFIDWVSKDVNYDFN